MRVLLLLTFAISASSAAAGDLCEDLWLDRNIIFDRAGYCFGSPLGQSLFDNSDCTTSQPKLSAENADTIAMIQEVEVEFDCNVETSGSTLSIDYLAQRMALQDIPVKHGYESACVGYTGPALLITAGRHPDSTITGEILPGMDLLFLHIPVDGMDFVDLGNGEMGWVNSHIFTGDVCTDVAG